MNDSSTTDPANTLTPLPPGAEARAVRRLSILVGAVPLTEMSQAEVEWVFRARVSLTDQQGRGTPRT